MFDLLILSLAFMIHLWALPYSFKNLFIDSIVGFVQLAFALAIILTSSPAFLAPTPKGRITGAGVGVSCMAVQLLHFRGARIAAATLTRTFILSQLLILFFFVPVEEIFYRGVFFARLTSIWGTFTAIVISTALSTMLTVVSSRKPLVWIGSAAMGILCALGFYYSQSLWAPVLIRMGNEIGYQTLNEPRDLFQRG